MKKILSKIFGLDKIPQAKTGKKIQQRITQVKLEQAPDEFIPEAERYQFDPDVQAHSSMDLKSAYDKLNELRNKY